jgi:hypothetical protein
MCRCEKNLQFIDAAVLWLFEPLADWWTERGMRREAKALARQYAEVNRRFPPPPVTQAEAIALQHAQRGALLKGVHNSHSVEVLDGSGNRADALLERESPEVWVSTIWRPDPSQVNGRRIVKEWLGYVPDAQPGEQYRGELVSVSARRHLERDTHAR